MTRTLDPKTKAALKARVGYYREMGFGSLYRRPVNGDSSVTVDDTPAEDMPAVTLLEQSDISTLTKEQQLVSIREDIGDCTRCPLHRQGRKQIVFGVGTPHTDLMFVGEAPGADEDEQGVPFVGRAGQLLTNMIQAMGLKREEVYIANVIKCRPPGNRTPEREECDVCSPFLFRQIETIQPKILVALGAVAAKTLLGMNEAMVRLRGRIYDFSTPRRPGSIPYDGKLAVTYHPAFLLRDPRQKKEAWKDLQMVMQYLGLPVNTKSSE